MQFRELTKNIFRTILFIVFKICVCFLSACSGEYQENTHSKNDGWTKFSTQEANPDWYALVGNVHRTVSGDFDGDKVEDTAYLQINAVSSSVGLFVKLAHHNESMLIEKFNSMSVADIGIRLATPKTYDTYCRKEYSNCTESSPKTISIDHAGIEVILFESSRILVYWDKQVGGFTKVWLTD